VDTGQELYDLSATEDGPGGPMIGLAFSSEGSTLESLEQAPRLVLWDVSSHPAESNRMIRSISSLPANPDLLLVFRNKALVGFQDGSYQTWDLATGDQIRTLEAGSEEIRNFNPDGAQFVSTQPGRVIIWQTFPQIKLATIEGYQAFQDQMVLSPSGRYLALTTWRPSGPLSNPDISIQVYDLTQSEWKISLPIPFSTDPPIAISPDDGGNHPLVAAFIASRGLMMIWNLETGEKLQEIPIADVQRLAFSPDSQALAIAGTGGIFEWSLPEKSLRRDLAAENLVVSYLAYNRDGTALVYITPAGASASSPPAPPSTSDPPFVQIWSLTEKKLLNSFTPRRLEPFDLNPYDLKGQKLARVTVEFFTAEPKRRSALEFWDIQTNALKASFPGPDWDPLHLRFNPAGDLLVGQGFKNLTIWDAASGQALFDLSGAGYNFADAVISSDWLALSKGDHTVRLWRLKRADR